MGGEGGERQKYLVLEYDHAARAGRACGRDGRLREQARAHFLGGASVRASDDPFRIPSGDVLVGDAVVTDKPLAGGDIFGAENAKNVGEQGV